MPLTEKIVESLRVRYAHLHPLLVHRSIDRARSDGDLFDILDTIPADLPIVWDESAYRWALTDDLFQSRDFAAERKNEKFGSNRP